MHNKEEAAFQSAVLQHLACTETRSAQADKQSMKTTFLSCFHQHKCESGGVLFALTVLCYKTLSHNTLYMTMVYPRRGFPCLSFWTDARTKENVQTISLGFKNKMQTSILVSARRTLLSSCIINNKTGIR
jgi:hypothetical protein